MVSLSNTAPTGATYYVLLGEFYNDSSGNITNIDDYGYYDTVGIYDSGWFAVSLNARYVKTTSVGTTKVASFLYFSNDAGTTSWLQGSGSMKTNPDNNNECWNALKIDSANQVTLYTGNEMVAIGIDTSGEPTVYTSGYFRIILIALQ
jgi:hypothetical protein